MEEKKLLTPTVDTLTGPKLRSLLYFVEMLTQAYEVKLETLIENPLFVEKAILRTRSRKSLSQLTSIGTTIYRHVQTLHGLLVQFGGRPDEEITPGLRYEPNDPVANCYFQEELFTQIGNEMLLSLKGWEESDLRSFVHERIDTLVSESHIHLSFIDQSFASTESRYRDVVIERFRVTAVP